MHTKRRGKAKGLLPASPVVLLRTIGIVIMSLTIVRMIFYDESPDWIDESAGRAREGAPANDSEDESEEDFYEPKVRFGFEEENAASKEEGLSGALAASEHDKLASDKASPKSAAGKRVAKSKKALTPPPPDTYTGGREVADPFEDELDPTLAGRVTRGKGKKKGAVPVVKQPAVKPPETLSDADNVYIPQMLPPSPKPKQKVSAIAEEGELNDILGQEEQRSAIPETDKFLLNLFQAQDGAVHPGELDVIKNLHDDSQQGSKKGPGRGFHEQDPRLQKFQKLVEEYSGSSGSPRSKQGGEGPGAKGLQGKGKGDSKYVWDPKRGELVSDKSRAPCKDEACKLKRKSAWENRLKAKEEKQKSAALKDKEKEQEHTRFQKGLGSQWGALVANSVGVEEACVGVAGEVGPGQGAGGPGEGELVPREGPVRLCIRAIVNDLAMDKAEEPTMRAQIAYRLGFDASAGQIKDLVQSELANMLSPVRGAAAKETYDRLTAAHTAQHQEQDQRAAAERRQRVQELRKEVMGGHGAHGGGGGSGSGGEGEEEEDEGEDFRIGDATTQGIAGARLPALPAPHPSPALEPHGDALPAWEHEEDTEESLEDTGVGPVLDDAEIQAAALKSWHHKADLQYEEAVQEAMTAHHIKFRVGAQGPRDGVPLTTCLQSFLPSGKPIPSNVSEINPVVRIEKQGTVGTAVHDFEFPHKMLKMLPRKDRAWQFKRCAVVGNSGHLLKGHTHHGASIDANDAVIRINYAPVQKYERHVGSKSTFDLINMQHARSLLEGDLAPSRLMNSSILVFEVTAPYARMVLYPALLQRFSGVSYEAGHVVVLSAQLVGQAHQLWRLLKTFVEDAMTKINKPRNFQVKPMSGFFAVFFASQICENINLYGFSKYTAASKDRYHYFDSAVGTTTSHSFDLAYEVFRIMGTWPQSDLFARIHFHK